MSILRILNFVMNLKSQKNILLIDDDHDNRVALRMALEAAGYVIQTAANGKIALSLLEKAAEKKKLPDLILLDMVMPLMDGEEFLKHFDKNPKFTNIKLMVISSYKEKLKIVEQKQWMLKPFDLDSFVSKIESFIRTEEPIS